MARDFRKIVAWQKADMLVIDNYRATAASFPKEEKYGLTSQMLSAAVSVAANIAEGSALRTSAGFRRFLYLSQGSLSEVEYYIYLAERLGYLDSESGSQLSVLRSEVGRTLRGLIAALDRQIANSRSAGGADSAEVGHERGSSPEE
jgi:four helix bundle protein